MTYAFVRSGASLGGAPNFAQMRAAGWDTPLFAYDDPLLAQQIAAAQAAGVQFGIWGDPHGASAQDFAAQMAGLSQKYNPYVIVPDLEFQAKGYQGSPGWDYNQQLAAAWKQYMPNQRTAVTVMPNQNDFNYGAWNGLGVDWLPQAYGADPMTQPYDPNQVRQTLINNGVDPSRIAPVLGPGAQPGYSGNYALWTVDDWAGRALPHANVGAPAAPGAPARTTQGAGPDGGAPVRVPDSMNPRAQAYARMRLGQLMAAGVIQSMPTGDLAAAWRQASVQVPQLAQQAGYSDPRAYLRAAGTARRTSGKRA